jgi:hypothetical protein
MVWIGIVDGKVRRGCRDEFRQISARFRTVEERMLPEGGFASVVVSSEMACSLHCLQNDRCLYVNLQCRVPSGDMLCQLNQAAEFEGLALSTNTSMCYVEITGDMLLQRIRLNTIQWQVCF